MRRCGRPGRGIIADDMAAVAEWLDRGVPVDLRDKHHNVPLWASVEYSSPSVFRLLLERGAGVSWKDKEGMTLLHVTGEQPNPALAPILVD